MTADKEDLEYLRDRLFKAAPPQDPEPPDLLAGGHVPGEGTNPEPTTEDDAVSVVRAIFN